MKVEHSTFEAAADMPPRDERLPLAGPPWREKMQEDATPKRPHQSPGQGTMPRPARRGGSASWIKQENTPQNRFELRQLPQATSRLVGPRHLGRHERPCRSPSMQENARKCMRQMLATALHATKSHGILRPQEYLAPQNPGRASNFLLRTNPRGGLCPLLLHILRNPKPLPAESSFQTCAPGVASLRATSQKPST